MREGELMPQEAVGKRPYEKSNGTATETACPEIAPRSARTECKKLPLGAAALDEVQLVGNGVVEKLAETSEAYAVP